MLAVVVSFALRFLVNLWAFWLLDYRGTLTSAIAFTSLLSGLAVPLVYSRAASRTSCGLPFASMLQAPIDVFLGEELGGSTLVVLALQLLWAVLLLGLGRAVLGAGTRKLVVQGG